ncbi:MAG: hypothetical protein WBV51_12655, partial [Pseudolabrys sp.]
FYSVISVILTDGGSAMKPARLKLVDRTDMRPVTSTGRSANKTYRTREHLTEAEIPDSFTMCQSVETNMSLIWQT